MKTMCIHSLNHWIVSRKSYLNPITWSRTHSLKLIFAYSPPLFGMLLSFCQVKERLILYFRFDPVYHGHFKCNIKSIEKDYPNILRWTRRIYQMPGGKYHHHGLPK